MHELAKLDGTCHTISSLEEKAFVEQTIMFTQTKQVFAKYPTVIPFVPM
jgi:hypothetical protein